MDKIDELNVLEKIDLDNESFESQGKQPEMVYSLKKSRLKDHDQANSQESEAKNHEIEDKKVIITGEAKVTSPLISVIIPAFNAEDTIERAVESVLNQNYKNLEVIVVDDASTDSTSKKVRLLIKKDPRVRLMKRRKNQGVSAARNVGIKKSRGSWFVTLDDDDFIDSGMLNALYSYALREDADLVISGLRMIFPGGLKEEYCMDYDYADERGQFLNASFIELYDKNLFSTHSNKLYKKSLVSENKIYYDEKLSINEDIDFVIRYMMHAHVIGVIRTAYLNYFQHEKGESLINTFRDYGIESALMVAQSGHELLVNAGVGKTVLKEADRRFFIHVCSFVGLMYNESTYDKGLRIAELKKLCSQKEFKELLSRVRPSDLKTMMAKILLKVGFYDTFDKIYDFFNHIKTGKMITALLNMNAGNTKELPYKNQDEKMNEVRK